MNLFISGWLLFRLLSVVIITTKKWPIHGDGLFVWRGPIRWPFARRPRWITDHIIKSWISGGDIWELFCLIYLNYKLIPFRSRVVVGFLFRKIKWRRWWPCRTINNTNSHFLSTPNRSRMASLWYPDRCSNLAINGHNTSLFVSQPRCARARI